MQSSLKPKPTDDPHDFVVIPSDAIRVAPFLAPSDDEISDLLRVAARQHSDAKAGTEPRLTADEPAPPLDASFRPTANNDDFASKRARVTRAIAAVLIAACVGAGAMAWQASGYAAKKLFAKWVPQFALTTSLPWDKLGLSAKPSPPAGEPAAADATPPAVAEPAPAQAAPALAAAESAAPITAGEPSDSAPLQSMARDLANVSQQVEALKASIAELKASQQQMSRELAKASEQNAHAKISPPPARPAVASARKPAPAYSPTPTASAPAYRPTQSYPTTQAAAPAPLPQAAQPYTPRQVEPLPPPQVEPVPRPPMPVQ
jgi:hypothetical protein